MCGIIAAFDTRKKDKKNDNERVFVNDWVLSQFEDQKSRGTEGFGIVTIEDDGKYLIHRSTEGYKFMYDIHENPSYKILMHHRTPTSTRNKMKQTHPITISNKKLKYDYLVVHNGVIRNNDELKKKHEKLGFKYTTETEGYGYEKFNDSEAIAIETALFIERKQERINTYGSAAFVALQIDKKTQKVESVHFGRNDGSPLKLAKTRGIMKISSEGPGDDVTPYVLYSCKLDDDMVLSKRKMSFAIIATETKSQTSLGFDTRSKTLEKKEDEENDKNTRERWRDWYEEKENKRIKNNSEQIDIFEGGDIEDPEFEHEGEEMVEEIKEELSSVVDDFIAELQTANNIELMDILDYGMQLNDRFYAFARKAQEFIYSTTLKK